MPTVRTQLWKIETAQFFLLVQPVMAARHRSLFSRLKEPLRITC
ncbi:hypothetical protein [Moorena sp. SIOASIH]|nr:hypothetical protein [Moorena sp. SIOASIH]